MAKKRVIKPKKRCCHSSPRCRTCPVVCRRLVVAGLAKRRKDGRYRLAGALSKKRLKLARAR